ncbi:MAG: trehalose-phosphatase [Acidimicrobiia bacterium]
MEEQSQPGMTRAERLVSSLPNALDSTFDFETLIGARPVGVCLDFDGTLSPIVDDPDDAKLLAGNDIVIARLASLVPTAIISGRQATEVKARLPNSSFYIAGSHGFEILQPNGEVHHPVDAARYHEVFSSIAKELHDALNDVAGAIVEEKPFGLSVHDRQVAPGQVEMVRQAVKTVASQHDEVLITTGKRVSEVRPALDWHKGHAVHWIVKQWGLLPRGLVVYIGDDRTDEDAFVARGDADITIVVASETQAIAENRRTWARFKLADPGQVQEWLHNLTNFLQQQTETIHGHETR